MAGPRSSCRWRASRLSSGNAFAKLDSRPYDPCASPRTTRRLSNGGHTFRVRATDPNGTDPTPALRSFRVKYPM